MEVVEEVGEAVHRGTHPRGLLLSEVEVGRQMTITIGNAVRSPLPIYLLNDRKLTFADISIRRQDQQQRQRRRRRWR